MMDGRNELMDAFFLFVSLARFLAEDSYGKKLRNVLLVFWLFFGHEDYGMPFSAATILPADDAVDVDVAICFRVVVCFFILCSSFLNMNRLARLLLKA